MNKNSSKKRDFPLPRRKESEAGGTGMVHEEEEEEQPFNPSKATKQTTKRAQEPCHLPRKGRPFACSYYFPCQKPKMHGIDSLVGITLKQCPAITIRRRKKKDLFATGMRSAWHWMERSGGGDGQQYSTSMVATGALLSLLRWLRTCRCRSSSSSCRRRCLSDSCGRPPAFPAAAADPATKSAATSASATKHALAAAMDSLALPQSPLAEQPKRRRAGRRVN